MTSQQPHGPRPAQSVQLPSFGGVALEVWLVVALFAIPGVYLVVSVLRVVPDLVDIIGAAGGAFLRFMLVVLFFLVVVAAVGVGLIAIAWLLFKRSRVGRGLAYVTLAVFVLTVAFAEERTTALVIAMIASLIATGILAFTPAARDHFTGPGSPDLDHPVSVVVVRVLLALEAAASGVFALMYLIIIDVDGKFVVAALIWGALAVGSFIALQRLRTPDRTVRVIVTAACGAGVILLLALGDRSAGAVIPIGVLAAIVGALWLPNDTRAWFGDEPLRSLSQGAQGSPRPATSQRAGSATRVQRRFPTPALLGGGMTAADLGVTLDPDGRPMLSPDELSLSGFEGVTIGAGWLLDPSGALNRQDFGAVAVFLQGTGVVRLTSRRLLVAVHEGASTLGPPPPRGGVVVAIPLEAVQLLHAGDAVALGLRERGAGGWMRLEATDLARRDVVLQIVQACASRRLQLHPRDRRRPQLEALHGGIFEGTADLGGELHLWEPAIRVLAAADHVVPAPAPPPPVSPPPFAAGPFSPPHAGPVFDGSAGAQLSPPSPPMTSPTPTQPESAMTSWPAPSAGTIPVQVPDPAAVGGSGPSFPVNARAADPSEPQDSTAPDPSSSSVPPDVAESDRLVSDLEMAPPGPPESAHRSDAPETFAFCPNCGTPAVTGDRFCTSCGNSLLK